MRDFVELKTREQTMIVTDYDMQNWVGTSEEIHERDGYKVRELAEKGFKPKIIVDIGAQVGMFATMAGKYFPGAFTYAFEPVSAWFQLLALNVFHKNCMPINACVLGFLNSASSKPLCNINSDEVKWRTGEPGYYRRGISVGNMLAITGQIDYLKIDCEGSEVNILRDMDERDALKNIEWIVGEFHFEEARREVDRILSKTHVLTMNNENVIDLFWAHRA